MKCFTRCLYCIRLLKRLTPFLNANRDYKLLDSVREIERKCQVIPVGVEFFSLSPQARKTFSGDVPIILWNQRWEYDENPELFFDALRTLQDSEVEFHVALCGQQSGKPPECFLKAMVDLKDHIVFAGFASSDSRDETPSEYHYWLRRASIVVSTASHENFGVAVVEAIGAECFPILPRRLSYPELIPVNYHKHCLYSRFAGLVEKLRFAIAQRERTAEIAAALAKVIVDKYSWNNVAPEYDSLFASVAAKFKP